MNEGIEEASDKTADIDAQMIPELFVTASPIFMVVLTEIFKAVISFFTCKWLKVIFNKKKEEKDEFSSS